MQEPHSRHTNNYLFCLSRKYDHLGLTRMHVCAESQHSFNCVRIAALNSSKLQLLRVFCAVFLLSGQSIGRMEPAQKSLLYRDDRVAAKQFIDANNLLYFQNNLLSQMDNLYLQQAPSLIYFLILIDLQYAK
ncbi:hypothetical protein [Undibacterium baiyunense]|uniref:hypothetical protein n=1 Tax=Undibacterium baiyunense TaxID=2828731 RepID=UPI001BAEBBFD|nr:hypothetical protein [Undibacterium baiyunense]